MTKRVAVFALPLALAVIAAPASATDCWLAPNYQLPFMRPTLVVVPASDPGVAGEQRELAQLRYAQRELGLGVNLGLSNPSGGSTFNADGAFGIGERMRAVAALGSCDPSAPGAENGIIFGGAFAMHLFGDVDAPWGIVGQLGLSRFSANGGSVLTVPIIVGAGFAIDERTVVYAGPMLNYTRSSSGGGEYSYSDSDTRIGAIAGLQLLSRSRWGVNAALALQRLPGESSCVGEEYCYEGGSGSRMSMNGSVRFTWLLGRHNAPRP